MAIIHNLVQLEVNFAHPFRIARRPGWRGDRMFLLSGAGFT